MGSWDEGARKERKEGPPISGLFPLQVFDGIQSEGIRHLSS